VLNSYADGNRVPPAHQFSGTPVVNSVGVPLILCVGSNPWPIGYSVVVSGAPTNIGPWICMRACCEVLLLVETMGHVKFAISMMLAEAGSVKEATISRPVGSTREL
jgi:hypothetical protein